MSTRLTIQLGGSPVFLDAIPLTREAFAPFGDVVENPRPQLHPSAASSQPSSLPYDGIVANQGTAIKYQHPTRMENLYNQAPSRVPGVAVANMFVCAARTLLRPSDVSPTPAPASSEGFDGSAVGSGLQSAANIFPVSVLERHPFTTQTFVPLSIDSAKRYLVVVAPSLPPSEVDKVLPVPLTRATDSPIKGQLPGRGLPDTGRLRAFVASAEQAVTYGAGTWHAPMVALGPAGTALDFLVFQFANNVAIEDCQEVYLAPSSSPSVNQAVPASKFLVRVPGAAKQAKL